MYTSNAYNRNTALSNNNQRQSNTRVLPHTPTPSLPSLPFDVKEMRNSILYRIPSLVMSHFQAVLFGAITAYALFYIMVGSGKFYVRFLEVVVILALCSQVARFVHWAIHYSVKHINERMHHTSHQTTRQFQNNKSNEALNSSDHSHKSKTSKDNLSLPSSPTLN